MIQSWGEHSACRYPLCLGMMLHVSELRVTWTALWLRRPTSAAGMNDCLPAVHLAALNGDLLELLASISAQPDQVNAATERGLTPLLGAASVGSAECVQALLAAGASLRATNCLGQTALILAACRDEGCVHALLAAGADASAPDGDGRTALSWAAYHGHEGCVRRLLAAGSLPNVTDDDGVSPLAEAAAAGSLPCVQLLLAAGARVQAADTSLGRTALHRAAQAGNEACVRALLAAGASLEAFDWWDHTPLAFASAEGHADCVAVLLEHGARATHPCLHLAATSAAGEGSLATIRHLVKAGADVSAKDENRRTARQLALANDRTEAAELLLSLERDVRAKKNGEPVYVSLHVLAPLHSTPVMPTAPSLQS